MYVNDLSFDPRDPLYDTPSLQGVRWGVQVFTTRNMYQLDPDCVQITSSGKGLELVSDGLRWAGQQQTSDGRLKIVVTQADGAVTWTIEAWHSEPIKNVKLMLWGLPQGILDKGWWQPTSRQNQTYHVASPKEPLHWSYP